ncbi:mechanosensitive ion channel protein 10-like [Rhodamnia argentea]|uniref:Mechanosensitive ion channel protein n=1 Tax=Rhodamnia argentea TaxID=178133 RepID=A0A8B8QXX4_9MYRT|nr:mechanosensitive ion channel protein 10-like [Rhodamnia argentea]XP_048133747.1 mechanosensitive ion channel protein 10-like [Rhodamnia argentea]
MEERRSLLEKKGTDEVVVRIPGSEYQTRGSSSRSNLDPRDAKNFQSVGQSSAQGVTQSGPTPSRPRVNPTGYSATKKFSPSPLMSKRRSRFEEPSWHSVVASVKDITQLKNSESSPSMGSPYSDASANATKDSVKSMRNVGQTPPWKAAEVEDDEHVYKAANSKVREMAGKKFIKIIIWIELAAFVCIMGLLIASLTVRKLKNTEIWHLELWKWCVQVLAIFCGRLVTDWLINTLVFLIEKEYLLKQKVLYFVYGLKDSVQTFTWLLFILLVWVLLMNYGVKRSMQETETLHYVTMALASCVVGAAIWLVKTLAIKLLASSFQCKRFFDRIQESLFHHYIVKTLSGPPLMEQEDKLYGRLSFKYIKGVAKKLEEVIDVEKLSKIDRNQISAWTMKGLVNVISDSSLGTSTLVGSLDQCCDEDAEQQNTEITSQSEAMAAADEIFKNVTKKSGHEYIEEKDLLRFMKKEDVDKFIHLVHGAAKTRRIYRSSLKDWLVSVYLERKSLAYSLNDTKTAIEELNRLVSAVVLVVIIIVSLLMMGVLTTQVLVFISSQVLVVAFMFGNTAKTVFEAIIFVFVMNPYDVGDRCVIDGVQMVVEEMNILTTVFVRNDGEMIFYPNSVLSTKPISNFYRSPNMSDSVEFTVDFSTSHDSITALRDEVKGYLEDRSHYWKKDHSIVFNEIEDLNKLKMTLHVTHTINFQNPGDRNIRRSELMWELKRIFEKLGIKYRLLPQEVRVSYTGSPPADARF